jgi:hypothetical protein
LVGGAWWHLERIGACSQKVDETVIGRAGHSTEQDGVFVVDDYLKILPWEQMHLIHGPSLQRIFESMRMQVDWESAKSP